MTSPIATMRFLRLREVCARTGYSPGHIYRLEAAGQFPQRVKLNPTGASAWVDSEIAQWQSDRLAERDAGGRA